MGDSMERDSARSRKPGWELISGRASSNAASKAAYWGTVATHVDPNPAAQTESRKLVDLLLNAAPNLKPKVEMMLATPTPPDY